MKKIFFLMVICLTTLFVYTNCKKKSSVAIAFSGYVNFFNGDVFLQESGKDMRAVKVGDAVTEGMKIITKGKKSIVDIYFGSRAVKVYGDTVVVVSKLSSAKANNGETEFFVEKGKLFSNIARKLKKGEQYNVKTPTTIAGVRGTEFLVDEENGKAKIYCLDGKVRVQEPTSKKEVVIKEAEGAKVAPGKSPVQENISQNDMEKLRKETEISKAREDILNKFEDQKSEIIKNFEEKKKQIEETYNKQKEINRKAVKKQVEKDEKNIKDQAKKDSENIKGLKEKLEEDTKKINPLEKFKQQQSELFKKTSGDKEK